MVAWIGVLVGLFVWAGYHYVVYEREGRAAWTAAPMPSLVVEDGPYRSTTLERRFGAAPLRVKFTAFMCLLVGPVFALMMFVPALFMMRSVLGATQLGTSGYSDIALSLYRLAPPLLSRDPRVTHGLEFTARLLRFIAGVIAAFIAVMALAAGHAIEAAPMIALYAGPFYLTSILLMHASRTQGMPSEEPSV